MDDFQKGLEQARAARMQGVKFDREEISHRNRIEEAVRGPVPIAPVVVEKIKRDPREIRNYSYRVFLKRFFLGIVIVFLLGGVGVGGYVALTNYRHPNVDDASDVIEAVGKLVALPEGEVPTVATVSDLAPLTDQPFFKDAEIGDKVLVFSSSHKAVLYRPKNNKVVTVAPIGN